MMKELNLANCTTNEEICALISDRVSEISYDDLVKQVGDNFILQEEAIKAIYTGLAMNMNVFLSGPGGYGKSTLIKHILDIYKIPYHTIIGYKDMPVDALLGIPNMDKLLKESEYELNFKNSIFYKPGILIGEEFTDILPSTAAALKDILTEKGFRNKGDKVESLIGCMIIAANKSAEEVIDDESKRAFYSERFPIKVEVVWKEHTLENYYSLLSIKFPKAKSELLFFMAKLFEENHVKYNNTLSPRTAITIANVYLTKGLNFINHFDINLEGIDLIKRQAEIEFNKKSSLELLEELIEYVDLLKGTKEYRNALVYSLYSIELIRVTDDVLEAITIAKDRLLKKLIADNIKALPSHVVRIDNITNKL